MQSFTLTEAMQLASPWACPCKPHLYRQWLSKPPTVSAPQFAPLLTLSSFSVGRRRKPFVQLLCVKGTEQDSDLSLAEAEQKAGLSQQEKIEIDENQDHKNDAGPSKDSSLRTVTLWVLAAVTFGVGIALRDGVEKASEYFAGYLLEQSLSVDNLFVFILIFKYFKVPKNYEKRVLSYGIAGAVIFRAIMILLGAATLQRFEVVNLFLALILLFTSYKLFSAEEEEADLSDNFIVKTCQKFIPVTSFYDGNRFFTNQNGVWKATPLLLTVAVIELSDIAFAIDSIPAVFGVTRDPLIVLSSNIFAITSLRSLYVIISESMSELEYLQPAIGVVLGFIGSKMILDFFGYHVSTEVSLAIVASCLSGGVFFSLKKKSD